MKRKRRIEKIDDQIMVFLKQNPSLKKALEVFGISYDQYLKTLEGGVYFYTDSSTSPPKIRATN